MTVAGGSSFPAEGTNPLGPISAQVTVASGVPTAVPAFTRPRGIAVLAAGEADENVYTEGEDPEIEALFDESHDLLHSAEENAPRGALRNQVFLFGYSFLFTNTSLNLVLGMQGSKYSLSRFCFFVTGIE